MKRLNFLLILLFMGLNSKSQTNYTCSDSIFESQSPTWEFTEIIYVDSSISKDALFLKVREWFSASFVSSKNVLDNVDKESGVFYGHGVITMSNSDNGYVEFTIEIRCKSGKIKYSLSNFNHKQAYKLTMLGTRGTPPSTADIGSLKQDKIPRSAMGIFKKQWDAIKYDTKLQTCDLIKNLKASMSMDAIKGKDDW